MQHPDISTSLAPNDLDWTSKDILRQLLYYHLFTYPLTEAEIRNGANAPERIAEELKNLVRNGLIRQKGEFYFLGDDDTIVERRIRGNEAAARRMKDAMRYSRRIGKFPFVRAVMLSGSLSKGYMDEDSDIDYFIVTHPGRLWIARTFLVLYKKLFLLNSRKHFCVNYFVDTDHLRIEDENVFTATEVVTLIPTCNPEVYNQFAEENKWAGTFYPNVTTRLNDSCLPHHQKGLKKWSEWFYGGKLGEWLDAKFMRMTMRKWQRKFPSFDKEKMDIAMRSRKYVSKHHPMDFQTRVLSKFQKSIEEFEIRHKLTPGTLHG
jgi:hypothetical protein